MYFYLIFLICTGLLNLEDNEHSHQALVKELDLKEEFCKSSYQAFLAEEENP